MSFEPPVLMVGTEMWRPISRFVTWMEIGGDLSKLERNERKAFVLRATWGGSYCTDEWVIGDHKKGLVCFCYETIPENWTYFRVVSVAEDKKSAVVEPVAGDPKELLEVYRIPEHLKRRIRPHPTIKIPV